MTQFILGREKIITQTENRRKKLCGFLLLFVFITASGHSQTTNEVIRIDTDLVAFEVTVTDRQGRPVHGLQAKDFRLFEDGIEREIVFFEPLRKENKSRPLSIVFALDVSGSMTVKEIIQLQEALREFVKRLADYNSQFAIITFGMTVKTLQSFTNRPQLLEKSFNKILREQDGLSTHAYDAIDQAIRLLRKKSPPVIKNQIPKRAIIVITDGFPVGDTVSPKTVIERANEAETTVYAVLLPSFSRLQSIKKPLPTLLEASGLIEKTGGKTFYVSENSFEPLFRSLAEEITASYVLAFYPSPEDRRDGKFREVRIETPQNYKVSQNRTGYRLTP
jgi:VWFA-related protein